MNFEEKYNEILEWARKNKARLNGVPIEEVLPELAESEDERIRKRLIEYFEGFRIGNAKVKWEGLTVQDVLAWLEKHSEEKIRKIRKEEYTNGFNDAAGFGKQKECLADSSKTSADDERIRKALIDALKTSKSVGELKFILPEPTREECIAYLEKQKEQKPLHWRRIEDATTQRTDDGCCVTSEKMLVKGWINDGDYRIVDEGTMVNRDILCIPVRELNAEQKEQKPEEKPINWTELTWEDINYLEDLMAKVHYEFRNGIGAESFGKEVLEKFREYKEDEYTDEKEQKPAEFTPNQFDGITYGMSGYSTDKPAEWSEEDEKKLARVIWYVEKGCSMIFQKSDKLVFWLKSLRPSWKPSEEQMEALLNTLHPDDPYYHDLKSLYEQLKKL